MTTESRGMRDKSCDGDLMISAYSSDLGGSQEFTWKLLCIPECLGELLQLSQSIEMVLNMCLLNCRISNIWKFVRDSFAQALPQASRIIP